jgi:hypothetical protein
MAVTIISVAQTIAGQNGISQQNCFFEVVKLSGTIANTDTGTYLPAHKTVKDVAGVPIIVGLPHGISAVQSGSTGIITFTSAAVFTAMDVKVLILCEK